MGCQPCVILWPLAYIYLNSEQYNRVAFIRCGKDVLTIFCVASRRFETKATEGKRESMSESVCVCICLHFFCSALHAEIRERSC